MGLKDFRFRGETRRLNEAARANAPGSFIQLSEGFTHYELTGPPDQTPVVLIHGFSVPYFIWEPTFTRLAEAGFRVLRYDLWGRGYSDRPAVTYNQALYEQQLIELMHALNLGPRADLVGLSMGGAIAVGFAARYPEHVRKLVLIDPAGMPQSTSLALTLVHVPLLGEWLVSLFAEKMITAALVKDAFIKHKLAEFEGKYRVQMQYRGFKRALLSTLRHGPLCNMEQAYAQVGQQEHPVLLIWGRNDQTVPFALSAKVRATIPEAQFYPIKKAGHIPHYEHPEVVNAYIRDFLLEGGIKRYDAQISQRNPNSHPSHQA